MIQLALTLPVSPLETPIDYLSRLAARNLAPGLRSFSDDLGLDFAALTTGDGVSVAHLCSSAGLAAGSFDGRIVLKTSTMRYLIGAEVMNTETLSRGDLRFCPEYVSEALQRGAKPWDVIHQLHWQFIQIRKCWQHGTLLQSYRPKQHEASRFDFTALVRDRLQNEWHQIGSHQGGADALDMYLSRRAYGTHEQNWCSCLQIPALMKACEAFGVLIDHGRDTRASALSVDQRRDAMLTGYRTVSLGPGAIHDALDRFNRHTPTRGGNQPHPSNGEIQHLLGSYSKERADLDPIRDVVREYFLDHYPFRVGTTVLGQTVHETRVFSMHGACREIAIRRSLLEEILIRRNLAWRDHLGQFHLNTTLSRSLVHEIRHEKRDYLDQNEAAAVLGCSFAMLKQLQRAGVLQPNEGSGHWKRKGFHRPALQAFLARMAEGTKHVASARPGECPLEMATRKTKCSVPAIVRLILDGKIGASARLSTDIRLDTLLVSPTDVNQSLNAAEPNGYSLSDVKKRLFIDGKTLQILVERGYLQVSRLRHSTTRVTGLYVTAASYADFKANYATSGMVACETGLSFGTAAATLRKLGVSTIISVPTARPVYRRCEIIAG